MSYFEVPGTAAAKQDGRTDSWDGRTDIRMSGQVFGWPDKGVYKGCLRHSRKHRGI